jgi:hypothetical protein
MNEMHLFSLLTIKMHTPNAQQIVTDVNHFAHVGQVTGIRREGGDKIYIVTMLTSEGSKDVCVKCW